MLNGEHEFSKIDQINFVQDFSLKVLKYIGGLYVIAFMPQPSFIFYSE